MVLCGLFVFALAASAADLRIDPKAQLPKGGSASEYWDLAIELRSGHAIFARFMITNEGPGERNGIAVGHLVGPDLHTTKFRNGRFRKRWQLSSDHLRLDIGKSHLDLHPPGWRLLVRKSEIKLDIRVGETAGARIPAAVTGSDYRVDLVGLGGLAEGSVWIEGMTEPMKVAGRGTLVHAVLGQPEASLTQRRVEAISQMGDSPLYFCEFLDPEGQVQSWTARRENSPDGATGGSAHPPAALWHAQSPPGRAEIQFVGKKQYPLPKEIAINLRDSQERVQIGAEMLRHNPLEDVPGPIRWILAMRMKPMRVWSAANFVVTLGPGRNPDPLQSDNSEADPDTVSAADAETGSASLNRSENTGVVTTSYLNPKN